MKAKRRTDKEIRSDKTALMMNAIAWKTAYYRENPSKFAEEFLGITTLKWFQKVLLYAMMHNNYFLYLAARGQGKTYLVALYSVIMCILYPGTHILVFGPTVKQGTETIKKITEDFMLRSPLLRGEILRSSDGANNPGVWFKNGSWIQVRTATDTARGAHSCIVIVDEVRMISQKVIATVIRPMNNVMRHPGYLDNPEYANRKELPKELYMSSAWYTNSELYDMARTFFANMLDDHLSYFMCSLPYTLSIKEHLLLPEKVEAEMSEQTFSDISFLMEYCSMFYGSGSDSFYNFSVLNGRRVLKEALFPLEYYSSSKTKIPAKAPGEFRVLGVDVALLASRRHENDASAITIGTAIPTAGFTYTTNVNCLATREGLTTNDLGLEVMRFYYNYDIDYIALDANGIGQAILDYLMETHYDSEFGMTYGALNCCNDSDLAIRCKVKDAPKVIYAFKATSKQNSDWALNLRAGFQNGYINLLLPDIEIEEYLSQSIRGYSKLSEMQKAQLKLPYVQTTYLIDEMINLDHDVVNNQVKLKEKTGKRKDRFSSLEYLYAVVTDIALKNKPKEKITSDQYNQIFNIRAPRTVTRFSERRR